jgi:hypothetical protein
MQQRTGTTRPPAFSHGLFSAQQGRPVSPHGDKARRFGGFLAVRTRTRRRAPNTQGRVRFRLDSVRPGLRRPGPVGGSEFSDPIPQNGEAERGARPQEKYDSLPGRGTTDPEDSMAVRPERQHRLSATKAQVSASYDGGYSSQAERPLALILHHSWQILPNRVLQ